jgi:hypothetical protein
VAARPAAAGSGWRAIAGHLSRPCSLLQGPLQYCPAITWRSGFAHGECPSAGVFRRAERDFELAGRYSVRAGWRLLCVLRATARLDPRWEGHRRPGDPLHPEAFCPDR